jgi:hypothetical protein
MKIRTDFVTNSSSSSFVLAFKDKDDLNSFTQDCDNFYYNEFYKLIQNLTSDYLYINNETNVYLDINIIVKELFGDNISQDLLSMEDDGVHIGFKLPTRVKKELQDLILNKYFIKPYGSLTFQLDDILNDEYFDISLLNFDNIESELFSIDLSGNNGNINKEQALNILYSSYTFDYSLEILGQYIIQEKNEPFIDYQKRRDAFKETQEYKSLIQDYLSSTDYYEKKEKIENSFLTVNGTIWDTEGGVLEWAIRNGFIEDNFRRNCIVVMNVG